MLNFREIFFISQKNIFLTKIFWICFQFSGICVFSSLSFFLPCENDLGEVENLFAGTYRLVIPILKNVQKRNILIVSLDFATHISPKKQMSVPSTKTQSKIPYLNKKNLLKTSKLCTVSWIAEIPARQKTIPISFFILYQCPLKTGFISLIMISTGSF